MLLKRFTRSIDFDIFFLIRSGSRNLKENIFNSGTPLVSEETLKVNISWDNSCHTQLTPTHREGVCLGATGTVEGKQLRFERINTWVSSKDSRFKSYSFDPFSGFYFHNMENLNVSFRTSN